MTKKQLKQKRLTAERRNIHAKTGKKTFKKGRCAICKRTNRNKDVRLVRDHFHGTEHYRDVLCNRCNGALGHAHDDPEYILQLDELEDVLGVVLQLENPWKPSVRRSERLATR